MCDTELVCDDLRELVLGINCDPENFSCIQLLRVIIQLSSLNLEFICIPVFSKKLKWAHTILHSGIFTVIR